MNDSAIAPPIRVTVTARLTSASVSPMKASQRILPPMKISTADRAGFR